MNIHGNIMEMNKIFENAVSKTNVSFKNAWGQQLIVTCQQITTYSDGVCVFVYLKKFKR